jgi:uroporphyrinogen decarboxylase
MAEMTSRERVAATLEHREPDRVPFDCSFVYESYLRMKDYLGLEPASEVRPSSPWLAVSPPLELINALNIDVCYIGLRKAKDTPVFEYGMETYTDEWGVAFKRVEQPGGLYYGFDNQVLGEATVADLDDFPWPDPRNPELTEGLEGKARDLYENTDLALIGKFSNSIFEQAFYMRGFEQLLLDLSFAPEFVEALLGKLVDIALARLDVGLQACGKYIQAVRFAGDDMGQQDGPLMSPRMFRSLIKPQFSRYYREARSLIDHYNPTLKIIAHTDGDVYPIIPDYIEMGLDMLNPVQPYVAEMEHDKLKAEFGDRLAFHAGIDIQQVMPFGSPEEVKAEAIKTMRVLGPGGGYILAPTHYLQADVPPENVIALRDAVLEFGRYPLQG